MKKDKSSKDAADDQASDAATQEEATGEAVDRVSALEQRFTAIETTLAAIASRVLAPVQGAPPAHPEVEQKQLPNWNPPPNPGKRFTIRVPNKDFNEKHPATGLQFQEGTAFTDSKFIAGVCRSMGYEVIDGQAPPPESR